MQMATWRGLADFGGAARVSPATRGGGVSRAARLLAAGGAVAVALLTIVAPALAAPHALPADVEAALARAKVPPSAIVAMVQEVGGHTKPRLAWQIDQPANPASLMKLVTTYAGLDLLGQAWTWSTPVWLQGEVSNGVLKGDLVVKGSGDPKLVIERLWLLLRHVQQLGVREIAGDIVLDRSAFFGAETNPADFDGEPFKPQNVAADALLVNFKSLALGFVPDPARGVARISADPPLAGVRVDATIPLSTGACEDWRTATGPDFADPLRVHFAGSFPLACGEKSWAVAYADPKRFNERAFLGMWQELGGKLSGSVHDGTAPQTAPTFESRSTALADVIRDINKLSNNLMAQQLFLTLGATQRGAGSPEASRDLMMQWLGDRLGNGATAGTVIVNGSGLSREGRVTARLMARLLDTAWASPAMPELMSSLPVAGIDGTLKRSAGPLGRAHLKTGTLRDVVGVAGYVLADSGKRYVLVAIVNHANANDARPALDAMARWVANDTARATPAARIGR